jgi:hypothetical protein
VTVPVRTAVASPLAFVEVTAERVPPVVENTTTVPLATADPAAFRTLALIVTGVLIVAVAAEDVSVKDAGTLGGVTITSPPPPPPQPNTTNVSRDNNRPDRFLKFMIFLLFFSDFLSNQNKFCCETE